MAQKIQVILSCDVHEGRSEMAADETIRFSLDGQSYEIDLCDKHAKQFRELLSDYVGAARRVSQGSRRRSTQRGGADRERTQAIRAWARSKGVKVNERGRLSSDIIAQYEAASRGK